LLPSRADNVELACVQDVNKAVKDLQKLNAVTVLDGAVYLLPEAETLLTFLTQMFEPFLVGYRVVGHVLLTESVPTSGLTSSEVCKSAQAEAEMMLLNGQTPFYSVLSLDLLNNGVRAMARLGALQTHSREDSKMSYHPVQTQLAVLMKDIERFISWPSSPPVQWTYPSQFQHQAKL